MMYKITLSLFALMLCAGLNSAHSAEGEMQSSDSKSSQVGQASSECTTTNLLRNARIHRSNVVRFSTRLNDGKSAHEGSDWNGPGSVIFKRKDSFIVLDMGTVQKVTSVSLQGDNNDLYDIGISVDGDSFQHLWTAPKADKSGMRTRFTSSLEGRGRYLKLEPASGDRFFSVGELQAFCAKPKVFPAKTKRVGKKQSAKTKSNTRMKRDKKIALFKIAIGLFGVLAIAYWAAARRRDYDDETATISAAVSTAVLTILAVIFGWLELKKWTSPL